MRNSTMLRHISRDQTLDYLFQETVEEQYEAFQLLQDQISQPKQVSLVQRLTQLFQRDKNEPDPYEDYFKED